MSQAKRLAEQRIWKDLHPKQKRGIMALQDDVIFTDGRAINPTNGKDVTHLVEVTLKTTESQVRGIQAVDALSTHEKENGGFIFAFFKEARTMEERFTSLTVQDTARLMYIGTYVAWQSGRLQYDNGRIIDKKGLETLVDMSTKRFNELFKRYEDEGILRQDEDGQLFINPTVFYRGELKRIGCEIKGLQHTRLFRKSVRDLYAQFKGRRLGQLAVVYAIIPFLNFATNVVSYNPEETDPDLVRPINLRKLELLLGYEENSKKLKPAMNRVKIDGKPVFMFAEDVNDRREWRITVNPRVVFGGNGEQLTSLLALFN